MNAITIPNLVNIQLRIVTLLSTNKQGLNAKMTHMVRAALSCSQSGLQTDSLQDTHTQVSPQWF